MSPRVLLILILTGGCVAEANPCPLGLEPDLVGDRCAPPDAGSDRDGQAAECSDADLGAWSTLFSGTELVELTRVCGVSCSGASACIAECVADAAGVEACRDCIDASVRCSVFRCTSACALGTDAECRACQCEAGCVAELDECARAELGTDLCRDVYGRPATLAELEVRSPIVIRRKSATGFTIASALVPETDGLPSVTWYAASGWTTLFPFAVGGTDYLLEYMGSCGEERCLARISPVTSDGTLARPVWIGEWTIGWDVFTHFATGGDVFILQYKSSTVPIDEEPRGSVRVLRVTRTEPAPSLQVEVVHEEVWLSPAERAWTHLRAFAIDGVPHLLRYRSGVDGTADSGTDILRADRSEDGRLGFVRVSRELGLETGWDIVETFPVGDRWFVLQYRGSPIGSYPAGTVFLSGLPPEIGPAVTIGPPIAVLTWPTDIDQIVAVRTRTGSYLRHEASEGGRARVVRIPENPALWEQGAFEAVHSDEFSARPVWDVVSVLRARLWEDP